MAIYYESSLKHHGVKGMKWGVRKARTSTRVSTSRATSANSQTYTRQVTPKRTQPTYQSYDPYAQGQAQQQSWFSRNKGKIALGLAGVAVGTIVAKKLLRNRAKMRMKDFTSTVKNNRALATFAKNFRV